MVRHLRKPGHPRRRRLVSYRPPVRSITPRQPPGRSGSPPPPPPPLSTFLPLSPSLPLFCSIFSLFHLPRLLLFDCSLFSSSFLSLSSSSSSSNCTVTLTSHDSSRHHLRVLVDSLPSPSSRTPLLRSPPTFAFSYLSHDSFSSDGVSLFQRRGSCFPPSSIHPSTLLAVVAATPAPSSLSHASRVRAEPDEIQRRSA